MQAERTGIGTRCGSRSSTPFPSPSRSRGAPAQGGELASAAGAAEQFRCVGGRVSGAGRSGERGPAALHYPASLIALCRGRVKQRLCFSPAGRTEGQGGQEEHKASFFPRWLSAGDAAGSVLAASSLPVRTAARGQLRSHMPSWPGGGASAPAPVPRYQGEGPRCPPASSEPQSWEGRLGSAGGSGSEGGAGLRHLQAERAYFESKSSKHQVAEAAGSHRNGLPPPRAREGSVSRAETLQVGHHTAGPGPEMRSETSTPEQPHSLRKSRREHRLGGSEEGWSLRSPRATASTPSGDVVLSAVMPPGVGPARQSCSRLVGVLLRWFRSGLGSPGSPAQMPSAVRDPELVIFLKRLAAHTPMKFFCEREEERCSSSGKGCGTGG